VKLPSLPHRCPSCCPGLRAGSLSAQMDTHSLGYGATPHGFRYRRGLPKVPDENETNTLVRRFKAWSFVGQANTDRIQQVRDRGS
jgi:hypothetical protein